MCIGLEEEGPEQHRQPDDEELPRQGREQEGGDQEGPEAGRRGSGTRRSLRTLGVPPAGGKGEAPLYR